MSPSAWSVNSFPKVELLTFCGVRLVSLRFAPVRALSYCEVVTCEGVMTPAKSRAGTKVRDDRFVTSVLDGRVVLLFRPHKVRGAHGCEQIGWQAKAPAPFKRKSLGANVGQ